jgi:lysine 2,3-aminomutase
MRLTIPVGADRQVMTEFMELAKQEHLLPIRVTPHYRRLVEEEIAALHGTFGPLYKVAYPTRERLTSV